MFLSKSIMYFPFSDFQFFFVFNFIIARLEEENSRLYSQVKVLMEEREDDQKRMRDLVDEVAKLTMEKQERFVLLYTSEPKVMRLCDYVETLKWPNNVMFSSSNF